MIKPTVVLLSACLVLGLLSCKASAPKPDKTPPKITSIDPVPGLFEGLPWESDGCLGMRPDGRAAVLAGWQSSEEGLIEFRIEPVAIPGEEIEGLSSVILFCDQEEDTTELSKDCLNDFKSQWQQDRASIMDGMVREQWTGCKALTKQGKSWEATVMGQTVALVANGGEARQGVRGVKVGPDMLTGAWQVPEGDMIFARFEAQDIVDGEGSLLLFAAIGPEELQIPRCLPPDKAFATFAKPRFEATEATSTDKGCLGLAKNGTSALYNLISNEYADGEEEVKTDYVWIGENPPDDLPDPFDDPDAFEAYLASMGICMEMIDEAVGIEILERQQRVWLKIHGHEARWLWTHTKGFYDSATEEHVHTVMLGPAATHLFMSVERIDLGYGEVYSEMTAHWHSVETLGFGVCEAP